MKSLILAAGIIAVSLPFPASASKMLGERYWCSMLANTATAAATIRDKGGKFEDIRKDLLAEIKLHLTSPDPDNQIDGEDAVMIYALTKLIMEGKFSTASIGLSVYDVCIRHKLT